MDLLQIARPGDLILRDLGCFSLKVFRSLAQFGAFFLTRCKHGLNFYHPDTAEKLDLIQELKIRGRFDRMVLVGEEKVWLRVVAEPVSEAVANERRRQAHKNRDKRLKTLESLCGHQKHVSLLRVARMMGQCACLFAAAILSITPEKGLAYQAREQIFYEKRPDRKNFYELIDFVASGLG